MHGVDLCAAQRFLHQKGAKPHQNGDFFSFLVNSLVIIVKFPVFRFISASKAVRFLHGKDSLVAWQSGGLSACRAGFQPVRRRLAAVAWQPSPGSRRLAAVAQQPSPGSRRPAAVAQQPSPGSRPPSSRPPSSRPPSSLARMHAINPPTKAD